VIIALEWSQVDLEARVIRLWPGTTKNDEGRILPLEGKPGALSTSSVRSAARDALGSFIGRGAAFCDSTRPGRRRPTAQVAQASSSTTSVARTRATSGAPGFPRANQWQLRATRHPRFSAATASSRSPICGTLYGEPRPFSQRVGLKRVKARSLSGTKSGRNLAKRLKLRYVEFSAGR
jgi:hypothetical protein